MSDHLTGCNRRKFAEHTTRWLLSATIALTVVALFSLGAPAAKADTWNFSLTSGDANNITFSFDKTATSTSYPDGYFQMDSPVSWFLNSVDQGTASLSFWNAEAGGGLLLGSIFNLWGAQLYSGTESAPLFVDGLYEFHNSYSGSGFNDPVTLTLSDPQDGDTVRTPEPSSLLMLEIGLIGMLGLAVYRSRHSEVLGSDLA